MEGRIAHLLFMFIVGRIVVQTKCTSRKMFTCGKSAHCAIVHDNRGKSMAIKIVRSSNRPVCFPNADHVMFWREFFCLFRIYFYVCDRLS